MTTIYVVTKGVYSDYHICGVYSAVETARRMADLCNKEDASIEEYELDALPDSPPGMLLYQVVMDRGGNCSPYFNRAKDNDKLVRVLDCTEETAEVRAYGFETDDNWNTVNKLKAVFKVWARDETHAIEIANEKRVQLLADDKWPSL